MLLSHATELLVTRSCFWYHFCFLPPFVNAHKLRRARGYLSSRIQKMYGAKKKKVKGARLRCKSETSNLKANI